MRVRFAGGRELCGVLKGYDQLVNLVLDEAVEYLRGASDGGRGGGAGRRCRAARDEKPDRAPTLTAERRPLPAAPADPADATRLLDETRGLGLVVCRGPNITVLAPDDGMVEIPNPFLEAAEE